MKEKDPRELKKEKELSLKMKKQLSPIKSALRLIVGFFALLLWILLGVPPTLIYSSGIQSFIGTVSFFIRNPLTFLLIGLVNIFLGALELIFLGFLWWTAFHFVWSIRWFYGFKKYRKVSKSTRQK